MGLRSHIRPYRLNKALTFMLGFTVTFNSSSTASSHRRSLNNQASNDAEASPLRCLRPPPRQVRRLQPMYMVSQT
jgi:hypothetical protein